MIKVGRILLGLFMSCIVAQAATAQLIKQFSSIEVADNYTLRFEGNKNATINFKWTDANLYQPGVLVSYAFQLDTVGGDFSNPLSYKGVNCCASFFKDTTMTIDLGYLADEIDFLSTSHFKKKFNKGDSITLDWTIKCNASGPNATYEYKTTVARRITFVRGQFDSEYVPVKLERPLDNSSFFVADDPSGSLKFQWTKAYCPAGCNAPQYQIMFDSMGGDFSQPLYFFSIPQSSFDTLFDLRQDVLALMMYNDGVPINTPKTYKWTIHVFGNGQELLATPPKRISLLRGLMRFENTPFYIKTPADNAVVKLEKNTNDSIIFTWSKTKTGLPDAASYTILFANSTGDFSQPIARFKTGLNDTDYIVRFGALRDTLDKTFGKNWLSKSLKWTVVADITGYKFMCEDTNDILIARGFFTGIEDTKAIEARVFPNPAKSQLNLVIEEDRTLQAIEICDAYGRIVIKSQNTINKGHLVFDISNLATGMYLIRVQDKNGWMRPIPFIKQ